MGKVSPGATKARAQSRLDWPAGGDYFAPTPARGGLGDEGERGEPEGPELRREAGMQARGMLQWGPRPPSAATPLAAGKSEAKRS